MTNESRPNFHVQCYVFSSFEQVCEVAWGNPEQLDRICMTNNWRSSSHWSCVQGVLWGNEQSFANMKSKTFPTLGWFHKTDQFQDHLHLQISQIQQGHALHKGIQQRLFNPSKHQSHPELECRIQAVSQESRAECSWIIAWTMYFKTFNHSSQSIRNFVGYR